MKNTSDKMSSTGLFELAEKYAVDRTILELETLLYIDNRELSVAIKERLEELIKIINTT